MKKKSIIILLGKRKILVKCNVADNFFKRALGIMFKKDEFSPLLFIFEKTQKISIHSFFCPPFIAVFLDDKKRVVQVNKMRPFSLLVSKPAKYLVELPLNFEKYF
jgi:uncharacterized membrane protein (UPF0127 family)